MDETVEEVRYAQPWERVAARAVDISIIQLPITLIFGAAAGGAVGNVTPAQSLSLGLTILVVLLIQEYVLTTFQGATLGKRLLRLQVQGVDGAPPSTGQLLSRLGVPMVIFLLLPGLLSALVTFACVLQTGTHRQGLHDRLAKTKVVKLP